MSVLRQRHDSTVIANARSKRGLMQPVGNRLILVIVVGMMISMVGRLSAQSTQCEAPSYRYFDPVPSSDPVIPNPPSDGLPIEPQQANVAPVFSNVSGQEQFASLGSDTFVNTNGGYIDGAIPMNQLRYRFDAAYDNPFPDRAEFFYAQCGCNGGGANGPPLPELSVDYQQFNIYYERALNDRFSAFIDAPIRMLNPVVNTNTAGFSDLEGGIKYALWASRNQYLTFQLRGYAPTGDSDAGLGTGHASIEPGFLYFRRLNSRTTMEAELRDWIPLTNSSFNGQPYDGNVLRYGIGIAHDLVQTTDGLGVRESLAGVAEIVGWSILDGQALNGAVPAVFDVDGQDIINAKLGFRWTRNRHSVYLGYGRALTGNVWYGDMVRAEYRIRF